MKILAIEASGWSGSLAAAENDRLIRESQLDPVQRTARTLAPALDELLREIDWTPTDIQLISVTRGPGSFTGLRVGVTTAKVLAFALQTPLVGLNTLAVIAFQVPVTTRSLWVVLNAERNQLFAAKFDATATLSDSRPRWQMTEPTAILGWDDWLARLTPRDTVAGGGLTDRRDQLPREVEVAEADTWLPRAASVARLGWDAFQAGAVTSHWDLVPEYFRESAAVEKLRTPDHQVR